MRNLPGEQYRPSNGTEGFGFIDSWCVNCARDKAMREGCDIDECDDDERCDIIASSFIGAAVEWRRMPNGEVKCLAFIPLDEPIPTPRCAHTLDMFGE